MNRKTGEYTAPVTGQAPANQLASWVYDNANNAIAGMCDPVGQLTTAYVGARSGGNAYTEQQRIQRQRRIPRQHGHISRRPRARWPARTPSPTTTPPTAACPIPRRLPGLAGRRTLPAETVTHQYETALDLPNGLAGLSYYRSTPPTPPSATSPSRTVGSNQGNHAAYVTNTYDPHTAALTNSQVSNTNVSATPIDNTSYTYDQAATPPTRPTNAPPRHRHPETQCFGYDRLDRLTQAWTATDSCAADPTTNNGPPSATASPAAAYWTNWTFDPGPAHQTGQPRHRRCCRHGHHLHLRQGQPNPTPSPPPPRPVRRALGHELRLPTPPATPHPRHTRQRCPTLTWSDTGQLTAVATTVGRLQLRLRRRRHLLLQKDPGRTTLYLPREELQLDTTTGAITGNRYYALPGGGQAVRSGAGANYSFEIANSQGTGLLVLDSTLTTPTWRQFTPYGAPRGTTPVAWPDNKGFLNDPNDTATGLTDIGARWYDPSTGRFMSLDPLFEADSSQEQNGYTYSGDNPIAKSDPTGLRPADCYGACETSYMSGLHSNGGYRGMGESGYSGGYSSGCWGCTYGGGPSHITWFNNFWGNQIPKPTLWLGICPWGQCQASPPPPLPKPRTCGLLDITGKCAPLSPAQPAQSHRSFWGSLWHDTVGKLRLPDYYTANVGFVFGIPDTDFGFGVSFNVTMTRGGKFYNSGGLVEGSPGAGASARAGWLDTFKRPSEKQIDHYINGPAWALEVTGGNGGPGPSYATVWGSPGSFGPGAFSSELGLGMGSGESWNLSQSDAWRNGGW